MSSETNGSNNKRHMRPFNSVRPLLSSPKWSFTTLEGEMEDLLETMRDLTICHREWLTLSQKQIAQAARVNESVVTAYESGEFGNLELGAVQRIWQAVGLKTFVMPPDQAVSAIPRTRPMDFELGGTHGR